MQEWQKLVSVELKNKMQDEKREKESEWLRDLIEYVSRKQGEKHDGEARY